jgi:molybdopterin synthase catalytic subunit
VNDVLARVTDDVLNLAEHLAAVQDDRCGAVVVFVGQVRDHDPGTEGVVTSIEYSAHPDAASVLHQIVTEMLAEASPPARLAVSHRTGTLAVGDLALVACVAAAHRTQAYELSRSLVEQVKARLPMWKQQRTADGAAHWVGL